MVHFFLIGQGILKSPGVIQPLWITAATVIISGILPSVLGVYGLYLKRLWGLSFFIFGSGAYLSMALLVLITTFKASGLGIMFFISIYLILYNLIAVLYSWSFRHHLREF
jgi:uncharacterized membrane protein (DUF2068 family)